MEDAQPVNAQRLNGDTASTVDQVKFWKQNVPSGEYPTATAAYQPPVERAGGVYMGRPIEDQAKSIEAIENEATSTLKEQLSAPTLGEITIYGRVSIQPGDIIYALPACNERRPVDAAELRPLAYEVERVTHGKPPTKPYTCTIEASFATRDEDIVSSTMTSRRRLAGMGQKHDGSTLTNG